MNGFVRAPLDVLGNAGRNENWSRVNEEERSRRTETEDSRGGDGNFANHANQSTTRGVTSIRRRIAARREVRHMDAIMTLIQHIDSGCMHLATKVSSRRLQLGEWRALSEATKSRQTFAVYVCI